MPTKNPTTEKLTGLPFKNAAELKAAQRDILLATWTRLEQAKALHELTQREEYQFWREEFAQGLACRYGADATELVRVFSDSPGIKVRVNPDLAATMPASETILGVLVKALSEAFAATYYKAKGILPTDHSPIEERRQGRP